ncbi:MAG TPA: ATP-binding protein [Streptosporangiaceae bacterium]|jgi:anti-anti-sigma factor
MTDDARPPHTPGRGSPGSGPLGAGTDTGGREEPPVLDQVFDADSLYALRAAVAAHGSQAGLADGRVGDLVLVVHELAANAVRHGAGRGRLRIWNTGEALRCEVADDGPPQAADGARPRARDSAAWDLVPGHGLWLIRQVADQASVQAGPAGTVATVSFALGPPGGLRPFHLAERARDGYTVVSVSGELDLGTAGQFIRAVSGLAGSAPGLCLVLDLSGLTWWDSSGLAALIIAQQQVSACPGGQMVVAGLSGLLVQRLRVAGLDGQFTLAGSAAEAIGMFFPPA